MANNPHVTRVLDQLRTALGTGEKPPGSNYNFIVDWYNKSVDRIGRGPWCEMTATWGYWNGGAKALKKGRAYTVYAAQDGVNHVNGSTWHWGTKGMRAGDQVYYNWQRTRVILGVDHTGVVERILGDGTFYVLEGNTSQNRLLRMRRDAKFVVGYVRYDWARLATKNPPTKIRLKSATGKPDRNRVILFQRMLEVADNGKWDSHTDQAASRMRNAARANFGYPKNVKAGYSVPHVQSIVDTKIDGDWGDNSKLKLKEWIRGFQRLNSLEDDGVWGPKTDNCYLKFRKNNYRVY